MYEIVMQPLGVPFGALLLVIILAGAAVYWWARKSAKHPQYAARAEAWFDGGLAKLKDYTPERVDALIDQVRAIDAAKLGAEAYARGKPLAEALEAKGLELIELAKRLRA